MSGSTTEAMSHQTDSDHHQLKQTPTSNRKKQSRTAAAKQALPSDIEDGINELYECIPQIKDIFEVVDRIGSGTFSSVYLAGLRQHPEVKQQFALKHIIPTSHPSRIENELRCLQQIGGCDYVMGVKACIREKDHVVIVMPYFPHDKFQDYVQIVSVGEVRCYMRALLTALRRVHQVDIIHRDVKPSNFLYNRKTKQFSLVDFGLAMQAPKHKKEEVEPAATEPTPKRTSPRKTRQKSGDKVSPQKKRKLTAEDAENQPESPRKKRLSNESTKLTELDINIERSKDSAKPEMKALTPITPGLTKPNYVRTVKSPRRMLLTKRALDLQQQVPGERRVAGGVRGVAGKASVGDSKSRTVVVQKNASGKNVYKAVSASMATCQCYGKSQICSVCIARSGQSAPRAGTQGFRSPEVLMKFPEQTTAVDIWSAGVIFLSLLSGRYPFFKAGDDITALAQVISIFGSDNMKTAAMAFGKHLLCEPSMPSLELRTMCQKLRGTKAPQSRQRRSTATSPSSESVHDQGWTHLSEHAFDLLRGLLDLNPHTRLSAEQALEHPFFEA